MNPNVIYAVKMLMESHVQNAENSCASSTAKDVIHAGIHFALSVGASVAMNGIVIITLRCIVASK